MKTSIRPLLLPLLLFALLVLGGLSLLLFPAPRFSPQENRMLASAPALTAEALKSGRFATEAERYATERFPARELLRRLYAAGELTLGKREVGGVILCRDGSLAARATPQPHIFRKNLKTVSDFVNKASSTCPVTVAIPPRRIDVRCSVLPRAYRISTEREELQRQLQSALPHALTFFDLTEDALWFHTDHHWTAKGAYAAYTRLGSALGFSPCPPSSFNSQAVSTAFWGTADAAAGIPFIAPDAIELLRFAGDDTFLLKKEGKTAPFGGFYDWQKLGTRDGYGVFLGGNDGILTIEQGENDTRPTLLVIKDSFANSLLPLLARHYRIVAVDPRYTRIDPADLLEGADALLFLIGLQTLGEIPLSLG